MPWKTKLTTLLSIDYPIIQGGMAYISDGVLAAAMAHAGCAGVIGSGGFTTDEVRDNIRRAKDILGPKGVYGVNLMLQAPTKTTWPRSSAMKRCPSSPWVQGIRCPGSMTSTMPA